MIFRRGSREAAAGDRRLKVEGDLRREVALNIKRYVDLGAYRGLRPPEEPTGARPAHAHQRAHSQGSAQDDRRQETRRRRSKRGARTTWQDPKRQKLLQPPRRKRRPGARRRRRVVPEASRTSTRRSTTHRHDHRPDRQRRRLGERRQRRLQGLAQRHAVRGPARRRGRRRSVRSNVGMRTVQVFVKGPGCRPRVGAALAASRGILDHSHQRRDADPAQRLPPAEKAARLTAATVVKAGLSGRGGSKAWLVIERSVCRLCRREGLKLFLKESAATPTSAPSSGGTIRRESTGQGRWKFLRVQPAAAREAEAEAHVPPARGAVSVGCSSARTACGAHRRDADDSPRAAVDNMFTVSASRTRAPRRGSFVRHGNFSRERPQGRHSVGAGEARHVSRCATAAVSGAHPGALELSQRRGVAGVARGRFGRTSPAHPRAAGGGNDLTMPINEKLVVELYSK